MSGWVAVRDTIREEDDTLPGCVARDKLWFLDIGGPLGNMASEEYRKLDSSGRFHLIMWACVSLWWCGRILALLYALFAEWDQDDTLPLISHQVVHCQSSMNRVWRETATAFLTPRLHFGAKTCPLTLLSYPLQTTTGWWEKNHFGKTNFLTCVRAPQGGKSQGHHWLLLRVRQRAVILSRTTFP